MIGADLDLYSERFQLPDKNWELVRLPSYWQRGRGELERIRTLRAYSPKVARHYAEILEEL